MAESAPNVILVKMLERLFASLVSGPALNCKPHSSRQRVDLSQLSRLLDMSPEEVLRQLLGDARRARLTRQAARPRKGGGSGAGAAKEQADPRIELSEEERRIARQWSEQSTLVGKLRTIAEDART